ncbi:MAG: PilZ domain-containing protein [Nitrospirae bacterium]|nr:PilZ domain-containing protein [Nitrospirota bacterium]
MSEEKKLSPKSITVYPSTAMRIACPYCGVKGIIKREYEPQKAFNISCPKCKQLIEIHLNKRTFYRKKVKIEALYQIRGTNCPPKKGHILDISTGGLNFGCYKIEPKHGKIGNFVSLTFTLPPREEPIKVEGEIVRILDETDKTITMGLKFKDIGEFEETQIGYFLKV